MIVDLYRRVWAHSAQTVAGLPLDAPAHGAVVGGPQETTLHRLLVHLIAETARHAGQMDIVRESIDGARGMLPAVPNLPRRGRARGGRLRHAAAGGGGAVG